MSNQITKRIYYAIEVKLASPLCVSSGENQYTDSDVLRNRDGEVFVPGTSLAGVFRNALLLSKDKDGFMGFVKGSEGKMSSLFISDLYFDGKPKVSVRDGVKLISAYYRKDGYGSNVENKFDTEIVEPGIKGTIYMEIVFRKNDPPAREEEWKRSIVRIIYGMQEGTIRLGANHNRGFGRLQVCKIHKSTFTAENMEDWLDFSKEIAPEYQMGMTYGKWIKNQAEANLPDSRYIKITVPLELTGGISIRQYSTKPDQADYEHITCNGKPVIPGSSWNGAIRSRAMDILVQAGCSVRRAQELIDGWFGYVEEQNGAQRGKKKAVQSKVIVSESILSAGSKPLAMTRNQVNRFDASTVQGALYSEISYFGGETELEILIEKTGDYMALYALLDFVIQDIQAGYVPVGGQVSIGRGIFRAHSAKSATYSEKLGEDAPSLLYSLLSGRKEMP